MYLSILYFQIMMETLGYVSAFYTAEINHHNDFPSIHYNIHSQSDKFHGNHHTEFSFHVHSLDVLVLKT